MKKIIFAFILLITVVSCEDELDQVPVSSMSSESFYKDADEIEQAVNSVYNSLSAYPERQFHLSDVRSDNFYGVTSMGVRSWEPVNNFAMTLATNEYIEEAWDSNYEGIMRANTVLEYISEDVVGNDDTYDRLVGETKFLRALFYFDLVKLFGPLPVIDHLVSQSEALETGRSPVSDVYDLIIADLTEAIDLLSDSYTASDDVGRATSWAAKGILARVYLTRSGPQLHPDGPCLATNEYDKALSLLNDIINNGPYGWVNDYASIFNVNNENNPDIVFDVQYTSGGYDTGANYPEQMATSSEYWAYIGYPYSIGLTGAGTDVSYDLDSSYGTDDSRSGFNILSGYTTGGNYVEDPTCVKFSKADPNTWGIDRTDFPLNFPVLRYTDVLMMKAECILQGASGTQTEADAAVNAVRERAGLDPVSNVTLSGLMEERRKEFFAEGLRWHDLVRTGMVLDVINAWMPGEDVSNQMPESIDYKQIIYPVPQDELDVKEGLYEQNEGYK